jgi:hypothetical protein
LKSDDARSGVRFGLRINPAAVADRPHAQHGPSGLAPIISDPRIESRRSYVVQGEKDYFVIVVPGTGSEAPYSLAFQSIEQPREKLAGPQALGLGDLHCFSVQLGLGETLLVQTASTVFRTEIGIYGPNGTPLGGSNRDDLASDSTIGVVCVQPGTYRVVVMSQGFAGSGSYSVRAQSKPAKLAAAGERVATDAKESKYIRIDLEAGQMILLNLDLGEFRGRMSIHDEHQAYGVNVLKQAMGADRVGFFEAPRKGSYYFSVQSDSPEYKGQLVWTKV